MTQDAQKSSEQLAALQQQLTAAQTELTAAQQAHHQLSQKRKTASQGSQTTEDSCGKSFETDLSLYWLFEQKACWWVEDQRRGGGGAVVPCTDIWFRSQVIQGHIQASNWLSAIRHTAKLARQSKNESLVSKLDMT